MAKSISVEELALKPIGDSQNTPMAYCVVIDGKRSPLYWSRRQAEDAVAAAGGGTGRAPAGDL